MSEQDAPTEVDLEDLAERLEAFCEQLSPRQQAVLRALLVKAAGDPEGVEAGDEPDEVTVLQMERSVPTARHAERQSAYQGTPSTVPSPRVFYVMGVPLFEYRAH